ncbi:Uncharacterized protein SCF082_LOCUS2941, partial [Durusdinium trenchii]
MACETDSLTLPGRREYIFLKQPIKRVCFQALIGVSSHRIDKIGDIDQRYKDAKKPQRPSPLAASVDAFCMVVYNSIAEPLPDRFVRVGPAKRSKRSALLKEVDSSGTDHWKGGTVFDSGDDPDDQDLTAFLEAN